MYDAAKVKACFESYQISQDFIDAILNNLEVIGDIYPYVDIDKNPPMTMQRRNPVDYEEGLKQLKTSLDSSDRVISKVFRATSKFISSFHDGHFGMYVTKNMSGNLFVGVGCGLPFLWEYLPDKDGNYHTYIAARDPDNYLDKETHDKIVQKQNDNVTIETVDGVDAFKFFSEFFGEYNEMKSLQGSLRYTIHMTMNGFSILSYPLDNLFDNHTITFSDNDTITFNVGFLNTKVPDNRRDGNMFKLENPIPFWTLKDEMKLLERLKEGSKRSSKIKRASSSILTCGHKNSMNYFILTSFSPEDADAFLDDLVSCTEMFDKNEDPITIYLPMNGGGSLLIELLIFYWLFPDADPSMLVAIRKTDTNKKIAIDNEYAASFANNEDGCHMYMNDKDGFNSFWKDTVEDDLGNGITHKRTKKAWWVFKEYARQFKQGLMKNPRKPTDVIVVTDGFCFSACSVLVDNIIRTGSGIVTGLGPTYPGDENYVAAQCPSSVIDPADYLKDLKDNVPLGIHFQVTYTESFNISAKNDEVIPGDFETMRIDKHLGYYQTIFADLDEIIEHTKIIHEEFKENCSLINERLLLVNDKCKVDDEHALSVGYACGSDGVWNYSDCRIATCEEHYAVDFKNNKCMINDCDPRYPFPKKNNDDSSSSIVRPLFGIISIALFALFHFIH